MTFKPDIEKLADDLVELLDMTGVAGSLDGDLGKSWVHDAEFDARAVVQSIITELSRQREAAGYVEVPRAHLDQLWRERNHAVQKVRAWEDVVYVEGGAMRAVLCAEWGPGEGDQVAVPEITPKQITQLLDEVIKLRAAAEGGDNV